VTVQATRSNKNVDFELNRPASSVNINTLKVARYFLYVPTNMAFCIFMYISTKFVKTALEFMSVTNKSNREQETLLTVNVQCKTYGYW